MPDDSFGGDTVAASELAALTQRYDAALQRVSAERDEALLRLLELEQEVAAHVCAVEGRTVQGLAGAD